jgi:hypothetical protein
MSISFSALEKLLQGGEIQGLSDFVRSYDIESHSPLRSFHEFDREQQQQMFARFEIGVKMACKNCTFFDPYDLGSYGLCTLRNNERTRTTDFCGSFFPTIQEDWRDLVKPSPS